MKGYSRFLDTFAIAVLFISAPCLAQGVLDNEGGELMPSPVEQICDDIDWEQTGKIDEKNSFFDRTKFECEQDWVDAENSFAPLLKRLGQSSFRPLVDLQADGKKRKPSLHIRKINLYEYGNYRFFDIRCTSETEKKEPFSWDWIPNGGTAVLEYRNNYIKPSHLRRSLKMSAADCRFFNDFLEDSPAFLIEERPPIDENGPIILHAGSTLFEVIDSEGVYINFLRKGASTYIPDAESDAAEQALRRMLVYFEDRTQESGRR